MEKKKLTFGTKLCYGIGNLGYGSMGQTVNSFIMFFATSVMGISGVLVGATIAVTSLWDGLSDPIIGYFSDRTKNKFFGRRLLHMLIASFLLAICNILLWTCPIEKGSNMAIAWLMGFLLLQETFNTFFATPYSALCIDIAPDYNDQTKMQSFKSVFYILGMIMPSILMYIFMPSASIGMQTQFNKDGYIYIAIVNSALVILCGLISVFGTRKRVVAMPNYDKSAVEEENDGTITPCGTANNQRMSEKALEEKRYVLQKLNVFDFFTESELMQTPFFSTFRKYKNESKKINSTCKMCEYNASCQVCPLLHEKSIEQCIEACRRYDIYLDTILESSVRPIDDKLSSVEYDANETANDVIIHMLIGEKVSEIVKFVANKYDVTYDTAKKDILEFHRILRINGLL